MYHARVLDLDLLKLPLSAKIQIHIGGSYGAKEKSIGRFIRNYEKLPRSIRRRLVIENDDRIYNVSDCLKTSRETGIPVLLDTFHHAVNPNGDDLRAAFEKCARTWRKIDGPPMVDYSSQSPRARSGAHSAHINLHHFRHFLSELAGCEFDLMLEIKDKEKSALAALRVLAALNPGNGSLCNSVSFAACH